MTPSTGGHSVPAMARTHAMPRRYSAETGESDGMTVVRLRSPGPDGLEASFAPTANLVLFSLRHGGREMLALNDGLRAYAENGTMMGVPLLYPWANRLSARAYSAGGTRVVLDGDGDEPLFNVDHNGLPIHGARPALMRWEVVRIAGDGASASLDATLEWEPGSAAFALSPFRHRVRYHARLTARAVQIALVVEPASAQPVPVAFGFHPYLRIRGGSRSRARMALPVRRMLEHDDRMIPTGASQPFDAGPRGLGETEWDDGFEDLTSPPRFVVGGDDGEVSLTFLGGYPFAQIFAPRGSDFVCFEPMTARTDALVGETSAYAGAQGYEAAFEIAIGA
jgi:aldose 1-epimerase